MEKKEYRKRLIEVTKFLNMKEICTNLKVDPINFVKFKGGEDGRLSKKKLIAIANFINSLHIELEDVPVTGTKSEKEVK